MKTFIEDPTIAYIQISCNFRVSGNLISKLLNIQEISYLDEKTIC